MGIFPSDWTIHLTPDNVEKDILIMQKTGGYNSTGHYDHSLRLIDGKIYLIIDDDDTHTITKVNAELEKDPVLTGKFEVTATEETISQYYVMFGDLKKQVYDIVETNLGTTLTIYDNGNYIKDSDPDCPYKTYVFNPETNELTLLCETDGWGVGGPGYVETIFDGDYAVNFYRAPSPLMVDVYDLVKKEYVISGESISENLEKHILIINVTNPLSESDEELVAEKLENFDFNSLAAPPWWDDDPEIKRRNATKYYRYSYNYVTGESHLLDAGYTISTSQ